MDHQHLLWILVGLGVLGVLGLWTRVTTSHVEPLSDERACRWDAVHTVMRCDFD